MPFICFCTLLCFIHAYNNNVTKKPHQPEEIEMPKLEGTNPCQSQKRLGCCKAKRGYQFSLDNKIGAKKGGGYPSHNSPTAPSLNAHSCKLITPMASTPLPMQAGVITSQSQLVTLGECSARTGPHDKRRPVCTYSNIFFEFLKLKVSLSVLGITPESGRCIYVQHTCTQTLGGLEVRATHNHNMCRPFI